MNEREIIDDIVANVKRPDSVRAVRIEFGMDFTDEPAVFITPLVDRKLKPTDANITELTAYTQELTRAALERISDRWPYVTIEAEPKAGRSEASRRSA